MSAHDDHGHESHGSYQSYVMGFVLSVVLTVVPFYIVIAEVEMNVYWAIAIIFGLGAVQVMVHVHYFLHVTVSAEQGWQALSLIFTTIILVIVLAGSIWVMLHLEENMMPSHEQIERVRNLP
ncbi:MAG: cytochrome o ubiquinol oxidase subunit IV [Pseudomonadota bacterium]